MTAKSEIPMALRAAYLTLHRQSEARFAKHDVTADQFVLLARLAPGRALTQRDGDRRTAERVADQDDSVHVDAPIDDFGRAMNQADDPRQSSAIAGPRPVIGQLHRQAMHTPRRHVQGLIGVRFLRAIMSVQENHQGGFFSGRGQEQIGVDALAGRQAQFMVFARRDLEWAAQSEEIEIGFVTEQIALKLGYVPGLERCAVGHRQARTAARQRQPNQEK